MSRVAPRVYVEAADIARLEAVATQLSQDARVRVAMEDGREIEGMVSAMRTRASCDSRVATASSRAMSAAST